MPTTTEIIEPVQTQPTTEQPTQPKQPLCTVLNAQGQAVYGSNSPEFCVLYSIQLQGAGLYQEISSTTQEKLNTLQKSAQYDMYFSGATLALFIGFLAVLYHLNKKQG